MDFFKIHLKEVLETIKSFSDGTLTVKRIRIRRGLKSSNRSKINFFWRALKSLVTIDFLELNGSRQPQSYKLKYPGEDINIKKIISKVLNNRKNIEGI